MCMSTPCCRRYQADYTKATPSVAGRTWGYHQGCDWARAVCIDGAGGVHGTPPSFCTDAPDSTAMYCTLDRCARRGCARASAQPRVKLRPPGVSFCA